MQTKLRPLFPSASLNMEYRRLLFEMASLPFLLFGVNISSGFNSIMTFLIQVFCFASYVNNLILEVQDVKTHKHILEFVVHLYWIFSSVSTIAIAFRQKRNIILLMNRLITHLPENKTRAVAWRSVGYIIFTFALNFSLSLRMFKNFKELRITWNLVHNVYKTVFLTLHNNFQIIGMVFYALQYDILNSHLSDVLRCLNTYIKTHKKICMKRVYAVTLCLHKDIDDFDDAMSGFPFFWFSLAFFSGAAIMLKARLSQMNHMDQNINFFLYPIITNAVLVILIWLLDHMHLQRQKKIQNLVSYLVLFGSQTHIVLHLSVIDALQLLADKRQTALGLVYLDRHIILSFISAFVSFTALFSSMI